ncbi:MAG: hypothetical protein EKK55_22540, partial [Rhodocyclaceae bacterium]
PGGFTTPARRPSVPHRTAGCGKSSLRPLMAATCRPACSKSIHRWPVSAARITSRPRSRSSRDCRPNRANDFNVAHRAPGYRGGETQPPRPLTS